jgi:hypothetical protein
MAAGCLTRVETDPACGPGRSPAATFGACDPSVFASMLILPTYYGLSDLFTGGQESRPLGPNSVRGDDSRPALPISASTPERAAGLDPASSYVRPQDGYQSLLGRALPKAVWIQHASSDELRSSRFLEERCLESEDTPRVGHSPMRILRQATRFRNSSEEALSHSRRKNSADSFIPRSTNR